MTKEERTKIVKLYFIDPGAKVLVLGRGHLTMQYFFSSFCLHLGMDQAN